MTEELLRRHLQPIAERRRRLYLAWRMAICWSIAAVAGIGLIGVTWLWGWRSPLALMGLSIAAVLATLGIVYRSRRLQPDYRVLARTIEQQHPELQALLLAAVEQKPEGPDGELGYLQKQVITEAVAHATKHDWLQSISSRQLMLAGLGRVAAMALLFIVLLQMLPPTSLLPASSMGVLTTRDYDVTVTPGDTEVERGTPVVVIARFKGKMPPAADLVFGPSGQAPQRMPLTHSLEDPLFGGILPEVATNLIYHIEYAGKRTRDYAIAVYRIPELLSADARIIYPPYTRLPEKVIKDTRQINVVEGSRIELRFTLNKPVATARLVPKSGIAVGLSLDREDPNVLETSLTATQSERYELHMADAQGRSGKLPPRFTIDVHKNLPPELKPVFPARDLVVSPLEEISLEAEVSDDYGVIGYGLTYAFAGQPGRDIVLSDGEISNDKLAAQYLLAMEDLNAQPNQLMTYSFWADDLGSDGQPRRTASDIYFAEVRPFEEIFRESQSQNRQNEEQQNQEGQQQGQQADQLARLQKQIITATWNIKQQAERSGGIDKHRDDLDVVRQSQAEVLQQAQGALAQAEDPAAAGALQAAAGHMQTSLDHLTEAGESSATGELTPALGAEQLAYQELLKLRDREHQVTRGQRGSSQQSRQASSGRSERQLQQLELTQRENRYETQRMAQSREQTARQENLQVLNRLRDLARRQSEMAERLKEAQAALQQARTEQERERVLRELKRLRDEQVQALRDMDELQQQMESPQNRRRMADAREQLSESRSEVRESAEALEEGRLSRAITSATRAQRQLDEMREEFQRRSSSQFAEEMRNMRDEARQLDERQRQVAEQLEQEIEARQKSLAGSDANRGLAEEIESQRQRMRELIEQMKTVSEQAETTEPLVSRKLYDTLREARTDDADKALAAAGELLRRNLLPQAQEIERRAAEEIREVREGVEEAARSVLGDESESLRLARQQLDDLLRQMQEQRGAEGRRAAEERSQQRQAASGESRENGERTPSQERAQGQRQTGDRPPAGQPREGEQSERTQQAQQGGSPRDGARPQSDQTGQRGDPQADRAGRDDPQGWGGGRPQAWDETGARRLFTGEDFRQWSDRLRDVEEMLPEQELREEAARVWERARAIRAEFVRHGKEPQWDLLRSQVMEPLAELRERIAERLAQLTSDEAMVPIDRDPVPDRYAELVRTYFENLGRDDGPAPGIADAPPASFP